MWPLSNASSKRVEPMRLPIIVGIWPFESALNAEFMANEVPGVTVPDALVERMRDDRRAPTRRAAEGVQIAREIARDGRSTGMAAGCADLDAVGPIGRGPRLCLTWYSPVLISARGVKYGPI